MSITRFCLLFVGSKREQEIMAGFDSEAKFSCLNFETANFLSSPQKLGRTRNLNIYSDTMIEISERVGLDFFIDGIHLSDDFFVVPTMKKNIIIGAPTIRKWRIELDKDSHSLKVNPDLAHMKLI